VRDAPPIASDSPLEEVAATVSEALWEAGIVATLSGGGAVSIYTHNRYQSQDLDFVTTALRDELEAALAPLGFVHTGSPRQSVFEHPETDWYLEFPPAPLAFGSRYVDDPTMIKATHVEVLEGYRLAVEFSDGLRGEIDVSGRLFGPVFEPLRDPSLFSRVTIDEFGVLSWPNGADLAPDALWARIHGRHSETVRG
jgi:hypothetical protein